MTHEYYPEKREAVRTRIRTFVLCRLLHHDPDGLHYREFEAMTFDLSEIGTTLLAKHDVTVGDRLLVKFIIKEDILSKDQCPKKIVAFKGKVVNVLSLNSEQRRIGVSFGPSSKEKEEKFFDIICSPLSVPSDRSMQLLQIS